MPPSVCAPGCPAARSTPAPAPRRSILPWVLAGGLFVFAAGMIANPWFESSVRGRLPFAQGKIVADTGGTGGDQRPAGAHRRASPRSTSPVVQTERLARTEAQIETSTDQMAREASRIDKLTSEVAALSAQAGGRTGARRKRRRAAAEAAASGPRRC